MKAMRREIEGTACGQRGRAEPVHAVHRFAGYDAEPFDDRAVGARPALERGAQAGGRVAPESVELLSRELGVPIYKLEQWREKADAALDGALKERESDPASGRTGRRDAAHRRAQHGGRAAARQNRASRPFGPQEVAVMAEGRPRPPAAAMAWPGSARSGASRAPPFMPRARRRRAPWRQRRPRRGPKPSIGDEALLAAIHADLERSPWTGEGHRKV